LLSSLRCNARGESSLPGIAIFPLSTGAIKKINMGWNTSPPTKPIFYSPKRHLPQPGVLISPYYSISPLSRVNQGWSRNTPIKCHSNYWSQIYIIKSYHCNRPRRHISLCHTSLPIPNLTEICCVGDETYGRMHKRPLHYVFTLFTSCITSFGIGLVVTIN
jgi:hypothetical protein